VTVQTEKGKGNGTKKTYWRGGGEREGSEKTEFKGRGGDAMGVAAIKGQGKF